MTGTALITGGQSGIGLAVAEALAACGHPVAIAADVAPEDTAVAEALEKIGPGARYYRHDLREADACGTLVDRVAADLGPVTTLVSNAGMSALRRGDLLDMGPDSFDAVMDVNLRGAFFLAQAAARRMLDLPPAPYRSIVFVTSASARMVSVERGEYCISKAGAAMMAQLFAVRLATQGIGVFDLQPGIIETGMTAGVRDRYDARIADGLVPAGRWGQPRDIAAVVGPLAAGAFDFATGAAIPVDGGLSIPRL